MCSNIILLNERDFLSFFLQYQFFDFGFGDKSIDQGFNNILVVFGHLFDGFKLVKEFFIGKGIVGQIIGGAVHQKIGRNPEGIGKFGHNIGRRERPLFFVASDLRIMYSDFGSKFTFGEAFFQPDFL